MTAGATRCAPHGFARRPPRIATFLMCHGSGYVARLFRKALRMLSIRHIRTRPYTPKTNGKAERFIQTLMREWAYAIPFRSSDRRADDRRAQHACGGGEEGHQSAGLDQEPAAPGGGSRRGTFRTHVQGPSANGRWKRALSPCTRHRPRGAIYVHGYPEHPSPLRGKVRFGVGLVPAVSVFSSALVAFHRQFPNVEVMVETGISNHLVDSLARDDLDLLITARPEEPPPGRFAALPLFESQMIVICRKGHPLLAHRATRLSDLLEFRRVGFVEDREFEKKSSRAFGSPAKKLRPVLETASLTRRANSGNRG
jgi:hypothetical protein